MPPFVLNVIATAALTSTLATSAMAQQWAAPLGPLEDPDGRHMCSIWSGAGLPAVGMQVYRNTAYLVLKAEALRSVGRYHSATLSFPNGASIPVVLEKPTADSDVAWLQTLRSGGAHVLDFEAVVDQFAASGTFSARSERLEMEIGPLPDASVQIANLRFCIERLDSE